MRPISQKIYVVSSILLPELGLVQQLEASGFAEILQKKRKYVLCYFWSRNDCGTRLSTHPIA
jgi:hypothetical protein